MPRIVAAEHHRVAGVRIAGAFRFVEVCLAAGTSLNSHACAVQHRVIDWAARSSLPGVRASNHDHGCDRRDAWVGPSVLT